MIDIESDPGSYADAIAHSPCLRVEWFGDIAQAQHLASPRISKVGHRHA